MTDAFRWTIVANMTTRHGGGTLSYATDFIWELKEWIILILTSTFVVQKEKHSIVCNQEQGIYSYGEYLKDIRFSESWMLGTFNSFCV